MKKYALKYAENGFAVAPLKYMTKNIFLTEHGFLDATTDLGQVEKWWNKYKYPNANIAIATGSKSNGLLVLDFDNKEDLGVHGYDFLKDWEQKNTSLPDTWQVLTGSGGLHIYFKNSLKIDSTTDLFEKQSGVDIRAEGGCVIAPPSIHPNGRRYIWECSSFDYPLADADDNVYNFVIAGMKYKKEQKESCGNRFVLPDVIRQGGRDDAMFRLACSLLARDADEEKALLILLRANKENCIPPLPEHIVRKKIKSAINMRKRGEK